MKPIANYQLGDVLINPVESTICKDGGAKQSLQPKFIEVLTYLAGQYPRLVGRDELIEKIWQDNQPVGEKALTNAIWHLRKNLKNEETEVIETIRKVGYRLLVEPKWQTLPDELKNDNSVANGMPSRDGAAREKVASDNKFDKKKAQSPLMARSWQRNNWFIVSFGALILLVLFLSQNWHFAKQDTPPTLTKAKITQLTKSPGSELFVSASPDGHYIAYRWRQRDGSVNLYLQDIHQLQAKPQQLTFDDFRQGHSVFSPDGQYLYFSRKSSAKGICEMIKMSVTSRKQQVIANCPLSGGYYYLDVSPDGKTLAMQGREDSGPSGIYFLPVGDTLDNSNDNKGLQLKRFSCLDDCNYRDRDMAFSPDGQTLAVTRRFNRFNENVYLVDVSTGQVEALTNGQEDIVGMAWHPNGKQLVFATQVADVRRGFVIDIQSKQQQSLDIDGFSYPAFAKKTGELFFQQRKEHYFVASLSLDTGVASAPFPVLQSQFNHHYPDYSLKAKRLVYVSNESGFYELWLADDNGGARTQLTDMKSSIRYPRWSHDGSKIAFLAPVKGKTGDKIHIVEVQSQQVSVVASPFDTHHLPTWRLDDSAVISAVYDNEFIDLYQFDVGTNKAQKIAQKNATRLTFDGGRFGVESPTHGLVYTKVSDGLWHKPLLADSEGQSDGQSAGQTAGQLLIDADSFNSRYSWRLSADGVYYQHHGDDYQQLMYVDFVDSAASSDNKNSAASADNNSAPQALIRMARYSLKDDGALSVLPVAGDVKGRLFFTQAHHPQADIQRVEHPLLK